MYPLIAVSNHLCHLLLATQIKWLKTLNDYSFISDPSAGSPTETLLRLLLPLNDQVWSSSQTY
jgi:hypothetical protein